MGYGGTYVWSLDIGLLWLDIFLKVCFLDPLVDIGGDKGHTFK